MRSPLWIAIALLATTGLGLEVDLLEVDLDVAPGQTYAFSFIARNETAVAETFSVYVGDWDRDEMGGNRFYPPGTLPRSLSAWLSVSPASFVLGPGESREVRGTLRVPVDAPAGTYWGIVFVHGEPRPVDHGGTTVMVARRIGVKVYATVGQAPLQGEIRGLRFGGLNPLWLVVEFANPGLVNLRAVRSEVRIFDAQGEQMAQFELDPFPCLPGGIRQVVVETEVRPAPGMYLVVARVDPGGEEIIAGQAYLRVRPLSLAPLAGGSLPRDLDGDGLYEDINGDGVFDERDVELFRAVWASPEVQANVRAFDFDNSGRVDERDVDALAALLAEQTE
ncbi:MAG: hypothetical protein BIP78_0831 [Candidatus Bipolaricaulis sibiricus]|uniref:Dockerin domain-containing protein n=1 Tax=Bipolaricaulis sibiricus TaxID=2501609 RepID=A0A410FU29_BIPS1|nr:MAG: hypothetical protein BIP78_0831 [Candidatus Bipolaricaulis sibiricus]